MAPCQTPVCKVHDQLFVKLEYMQIGGSHKARAARQVIVDAESRELLKRDGTHIIIEKSGGNFGIGLAAHAIPLGYRLGLLVRPSFSAFRRYLLKHLGADLIGEKEMAAGANNQEIIDLYIDHYNAAGFTAYYPDQFSNQSCIKAHETGAEEFVTQLFSYGLSKTDPVVLVKCVGSGASINAYSRVFRNNFINMDVVIVQPDGCSFQHNVFLPHPFDGASVGFVPTFLKGVLESNYVTIRPNDAFSAIKYLFNKTGVFAGRSSGLALAGAMQIAASSKRVVVMIAYDGGEHYLADAYHQASPSIG